MGFVAVPMEELLFIDLADYYLEDYIYDADGNDIPEITAQHLYIYVHEFLLGLDWSDIYITDGPGSIYLADGLFGLIDENLRYDLNGAYPAVDGRGLTADQIVLSDGDFLNVAHYADWTFGGDSTTGFHYFTDTKDNLQHTYQALVGEPLEPGFVRSYSDWNNGGLPAYDPGIGYEIYYGMTKLPFLIWCVPWRMSWDSTGSGPTTLLPMRSNLIAGITRKTEKIILD